VRKQDQNKGFNLYVNKFMSACYILLHGTYPPRMFHEFKKILQLRKHTRLGYWYLDEDHTIIRVYGFEQDPYKLSIFLTPRIFFWNTSDKGSFEINFIFPSIRRPSLSNYLKRLALSWSSLELL
jgi:hypothetical protein